MIEPIGKEEPPGTKMSRFNLLQLTILHSLFIRYSSEDKEAKLPPKNFYLF